MEKFYELLDKCGPLTWMLSSTFSFFATSLLHHYTKKFYHVLYMVFFFCCATWGLLIVGGVEGMLSHICMGILPFIAGIAALWGLILRLNEFIKIKKQQDNANKRVTNTI